MMQQSLLWRHVTEYETERIQNATMQGEGLQATITWTTATPMSTLFATFIYNDR